MMSLAFSTVKRESFLHLLFDCCVARLVWCDISDIPDEKAVGVDFESAAK